MGSHKLVSIVVPLHNEALSLPHLHEALANVTKQLKNYTFEFILVDDGSTDTSVTLAQKLQAKDKRIRILELSRNFGKEPAVAAGLQHARGQAAIVMDADLQHPPELIGDFLKSWEKGHDVVVGIRQYDQAEPRFKRFMSALFYRIMDKITHTKIVPHATDYRLIDRKVIDTFNSLTERNRINRGLIDWLGYKRDYIHFTANLRQHGQASYTLRKLFGLAFNTVTSYSLFPLRLAGYLGVIILVLSLPTSAFLLAEQYLMGDPMQLEITGTGFMAMILILFVGVILACLGLIALYIAHIHAEVTNRPLYVIRRDIHHLEELSEELLHPDIDLAYGVQSEDAAA